MLEDEKNNNKQTIFCCQIYSLFPSLQIQIKKETRNFHQNCMHKALLLIIHGQYSQNL